MCPTYVLGDFKKDLHVGLGHFVQHQSKWTIFREMWFSDLDCSSISPAGIHTWSNWIAHVHPLYIATICCSTVHSTQLSLKVHVHNKRRTKIAEHKERSDWHALGYIYCIYIYIYGPQLLALGCTIEIGMKQNRAIQGIESRILSLYPQNSPCTCTD